MLKRFVERIVAGGWQNFEDWYFNGFRASCAQAFAQFARLVRSARNEDSLVFKRKSHCSTLIIAPQGEKPG